MELPKLSAWAISHKIIAWIVENFRKGDTILELGSGDGSAHLAETFEVYSVEHDREWVDKYEKVNYIYAPIKKHKAVKKFDKNEWYNWSLLEPQIQNIDYDLIICDGPPSCFGRAGFLKYVDQFPKKTPIIFDDVNRISDLNVARKIANKWGESLLLKGLDEDKHWAILWPGRY